MRTKRILATAGLALGACVLGACATSGHGTAAETPADLARMSMARELVQRADWAGAFPLLCQIHQQRPDDAEVLALRGIVYRERGLYTEAETDLRAALGILFDVQMRPGAEAEHREAVRLAPNNPAFLNNLAFSLFLREHYKEAITMYEKAARLAPLSHRVRTNMGFAYAAIGDLPSAAREFRMGGTEVDAANNLGFAYERRGDMANAYALYLQAVRTDPSAARARSNLMHAALVLGRPVPDDVSAPAKPTASAAAPATSPALASPPALAKQPVANP